MKTKVKLFALGMLMAASLFAVVKPQMVSAASMYPVWNSPVNSNGKLIVAIDANRTRFSYLLPGMSTKGYGIVVAAGCSMAVKNLSYFRSQTQYFSGGTWFMFPNLWASNYKVFVSC